MIALNAFNIKKEGDNKFDAVFEVAPLPKGYGETLGNVLRRILLSSIPGSAITAIKLNGVQHEYSTMKGVKDDVLTLLLSLKNIVVISKVEGDVVLNLKVKGKKGAVTEVKASDIEKNSDVEVINQDYVITTLTDDVTFEAQLHVSNGVGYTYANQEVRKELGVLPVDSNYSPVKLVSYDITPTRVGQETELDQLNIRVVTNGSIPSTEALFTSTNILKEMSAHFFNQAEDMLTQKVVRPINLAKEEAKEEIKEERKVLKVVDLNLSTRLTNALLRAGYEDLNQLEGMTEEELANIKGMGQKSLDELIKTLKKHNIKII